MNNLSVLTGALLVASMTPAEVAVVYAASSIFSRVFNVTSITGRLDSSFADTTVYTAVHNLAKAGVFNMINSNGNKMKDKVIELTFTPKGREICALIKTRHSENKTTMGTAQGALI